MGSHLMNTNENDAASINWMYSINCKNEMNEKDLNLRIPK